jgi:hypothetical protein
MTKMLETQVGQLVGCPMDRKWRLSGQPQGPETAKDTQTHAGEMEDHTKETMKITTKDWSLRCRATTWSCCIRQDQTTKPVCDDQKYD